jgi:hypothetical protein
MTTANRLITHLICLKKAESITRISTGSNTKKKNLTFNRILGIQASFFLSLFLTDNKEILTSNSDCWMESVGEMRNA